MVSLDNCPTACGNRYHLCWHSTGHALFGKGWRCQWHVRRSHIRNGLWYPLRFTGWRRRRRVQRICCRLGRRGSIRSAGWIGKWHARCGHADFHRQCSGYPDGVPQRRCSRIAHRGFHRHSARPSGGIARRISCRHPQWGLRWNCARCPFCFPVRRCSRNLYRHHVRGCHGRPITSKGWGRVGFICCPANPVRNHS